MNGTQVILAKVKLRQTYGLEICLMHALCTPTVSLHTYHGMISWNGKTINSADDDKSGHNIGCMPITTFSGLISAHIQKKNSRSEKKSECSSELMVPLTVCFSCFSDS